MKSKTNDEFKIRLADFEDKCRKVGIKVTSQRLEIFSRLLHSSDHPDAETIHRRVIKKLPTVSLDTVYRNLWLFINMGIVSMLSSPQGKHRYEANMDHHHHFYCCECGATFDFSDSELISFMPPKSLELFGRVEKTCIEFQGICRKCLEKKAKKRS